MLCRSATMPGHCLVQEEEREGAWHYQPEVGSLILAKTFLREFCLQKRSRSSSKKENKTIKSLLLAGCWQAIPSLLGGTVGVSTVLSLGAGGHCLGGETSRSQGRGVKASFYFGPKKQDLLLTLRQAGGRSLGQAWVPCWLNPGAGERLAGQRGLDGIQSAPYTAINLRALL